jgi:hypothetical protein
MPDDTTNLADRPSGGSDQTSEQPDDSAATAAPAQDDATKPVDPAQDQRANLAPPVLDDTGKPADQPAQQPEDKPAETLSAGRQNMLDLINKWMPTSLNQPRIPDGETQDLMVVAGWTKARGEESKSAKDNHQPVVTSCGDILSAMLRLWRSNFVGAFMIRDLDSRGKAPGAKGLGYYVEADGVQGPKPGDILVLRSGFGPGSAGTVGHVGILVEASADVWRTADGGGGALPDQTASVTARTVRWDNNIAILKSPTDRKEKQVDGWVDLDKLQQTG